MMVINLAKIQTKSVVLTVNNSCLPKRLANVTVSWRERKQRKTHHPNECRQEMTEHIKLGASLFYFSFFSAKYFRDKLAVTGLCSPTNLQ